MYLTIVIQSGSAVAELSTVLKELSLIFKGSERYDIPGVYLISPLISLSSLSLSSLVFLYQGML